MILELDKCFYCMMNKVEFIIFNLVMKFGKMKFGRVFGI